MLSQYELARQGDPEAKRALVNRLQPRLARMAGHYARRTGEDAEDLLQEAWAGLLEALPDMDVRIGSPEQYLISRARWRLLDSIRRARVRRCLPLDDVPETCAPSAELETAMGDRAVGEFLSVLQQTQRTVLQHLLLGLTWREAGERMGCTSANVAYHVRKIRSEYARWQEAA